MIEKPFLLALAERLTSGLSTIPESTLQKHRQFVLSQQMTDGGFRGREGGSDLYYTSFAIRCLGLTGGINHSEAENIVDYLSGFQWRSLENIDLKNYIYSA